MWKQLIRAQQHTKRDPPLVRCPEGFGLPATERMFLSFRVWLATSLLLHRYAKPQPDFVAL